MALAQSRDSRETAINDASVGRPDDALRTRRVNVNFSGPAYEQLTALSRETGESMSDVIRQAIALRRWYERTQREGGRILVERDGQVRELVPF